jgi:hypothetical protein
MKIMLALARMERRRMSKHGGAQRPVRSIAALGRVDSLPMKRVRPRVQTAFFPRFTFAGVRVPTF